MTTWTFSSWWGGQVADCGPYLGDYPVLAPFPQDLPSGTSGLVYLVYTGTLAHVLAGDDPNMTLPGTGEEASTTLNVGPPPHFSRSGVGDNPPSAPLPGTPHLFVVWYGVGGDPGPPAYDALTVVPASYAAGGTADGPDLNLNTSPASQFVADNGGVGVFISDGGGSLHTGTFYYGNVAVGALSDGSFIIVASKFVDASNTMDFRMWHLDSDLNIIGTIDFSAPGGAQWQTFANCAGVVRRSTGGHEYLFVASDGNHASSSTVYTWLFDCSTPTPTITSSNANLTSIDRFTFFDCQAIQPIDVPTGNVDGDYAFFLHRQLTAGGTRQRIWVAVISYDSGGSPQFQYTAEVSNTINYGPVYFYADPNDPMSLAVADIKDGIYRISNDEDLLDFGVPTVQNAMYSYTPIGGSNPLESPAIILNENEEDWGVNYLVFVDPVTGEFVGATNSGFSIGDYEDGNSGTGGSAWSNTRLAGKSFFSTYLMGADSPPYDLAIRCAGVDYSDGIKVDVFDLTLPAPLDASFWDFTEGAESTDTYNNVILVAGCMYMDNDHTLPVVAWTVRRTPPAVLGGQRAWGIPLGSPT